MEERGRLLPSTDDETRSEFSYIAMEGGSHDEQKRRRHTVIGRSWKIAESVRPSLDREVIHRIVEDDPALRDDDPRAPVPLQEQQGKEYVRKSIDLCCFPFL